MNLEFIIIEEFQLMKNMMVSINSISLTLDTWKLKLEKPEVKIWQNEYKDQLSIDLFLKDPGLPKYSPDISALRRFYRNNVSKSNGALIAVEKEYLDSLLAIKLIIKFSQKPAGFVFLASYTIPREQFSYVIKAICKESEMTGIRESVILDKLVGKGIIKDIRTKVGWFFDPYDPKHEAPVLSNMADKEEYDELFPNHPLSRARNALKTIKNSLKFSDDVLESKNFFVQLK